MADWIGSLGRVFWPGGQQWTFWRISDSWFSWLGGLTCFSLCFYLYWKVTGFARSGEISFSPHAALGARILHITIVWLHALIGYDHTPLCHWLSIEVYKWFPLNKSIGSNSRLFQQQRPSHSVEGEGKMQRSRVHGYVSITQHVNCGTVIWEGPPSPGLLSASREIHCGCVIVHPLATSSFRTGFLILSTVTILRCGGLSCALHDV